MKYDITDLGLIDYKDSYLFQKRAVTLAKANAAAGMVIFAEHNPVFTIGRSGTRDNILASHDKLDSYNIDVIETDRGGDITFHGPGQIVMYPIIDLKVHYKDMHRFMRELEEVVICALSDFNIESFRIKDRTGCWHKKGKICSIGIGASNWITYHGLALNVNVDLTYFDMINPCGLKEIRTTSMQDILGEEVDKSVVKERLIEHFNLSF